MCLLWRAEQVLRLPSATVHQATLGMPSALYNTASKLAETAERNHPHSQGRPCTREGGSVKAAGVRAKSCSEVCSERRTGANQRTRLTVFGVIEHVCRMCRATRGLWRYTKQGKSRAPRGGDTRGGDVRRRTRGTHTLERGTEYKHRGAAAFYNHFKVLY